MHAGLGFSHGSEHSVQLLKVQKVHFRGDGRYSSLSRSSAKPFTEIGETGSVTCGNMEHSPTTTPDLLVAHLPLPKVCRLSVLSVDGQRIIVRCSARLGGALVCTAQQLEHYCDPEDLYGEEWELNDEEITALDLQGAANPMVVEAELPDMKAEAMAREGFYMVKSIN